MPRKTRKTRIKKVINLMSEPVIRAYVTGDDSNLDEDGCGDLYFLNKPFQDGTVLIGSKLILKSEIDDLKKAYQKKMKLKSSAQPHSSEPQEAVTIGSRSKHFHYGYKN